MPGGDRTGPTGQGTRSGRGKGLCGGNDRSGYYDDENRRHEGRRKAQTGEGRGSGLGRSRGRGRGNA
ncbi:DUF5320 domain-containing protein [Marinilabilia rubra]|uniref:Uncharacterized protein n=1 Tax=Marinilabilia rubra TaxID=2162893 RepID=A0A2U2B6Z4_9BACT|nr:DUF5320 domain-containing protein [Marinilabilia rubra]PWD98838.1 hypothetical protein DDZ16_13965 [Marinilabilia rubra]